MNHEIIALSEFNKRFDGGFDYVNGSTGARKTLEQTNDPNKLVLVTLEEAESINCKYDQQSSDDDIKLIEIILKHSSIYGLSGEVILSALITIKENPTISIMDAIQNSFSDWIK